MNLKIKQKNIIKTVGIIALIIYGIAIVLFSYKQEFFSFKKASDGSLLGQLGSFIGGIITPVITFLSIILFSRALKLQRKDLNEQKLEFQKQNKLALTQQFESKFFNLLNLHNQIKNNIESSGSRGIQFNLGKTFFEELTYKIVTVSKETGGKLINNESIKIHAQPKKQLIKFYDKVFYEYKAFLGHYFRNLFHLIKFIDEYDEFEDKGSFEVEKYKYVRIIRSQLSNAEIILLAYNGLTDYGGAFYVTIEKYQLLKNMAFDDTVVGLKEVLVKSYPHLEKAYGSPTAKKSL